MSLLYQCDSYSPLHATEREHKHFPSIKMSNADIRREQSILRSETEVKSILHFLFNDSRKNSLPKSTKKTKTDKTLSSKKVRIFRMMTKKKSSKKQLISIKQSGSPIETSSPAQSPRSVNAVKDTLICKLRRKVLASQSKLVEISPNKSENIGIKKVSVNRCLKMCNKALENSTELSTIIVGLGEHLSTDKQLKERFTEQMKEKKNLIEMFPQIKEKWSVYTSKNQKTLFMKEQNGVTDIRDNMEDFSKTKDLVEKAQKIRLTKSNKDKHRQVETMLNKLRATKNKIASRLNHIK